MLFLLVALVAPFAEASSSCGYDGVDISPLTKPAGQQDWTWNDRSAPVYYWDINPCGLTNVTCNGAPALSPAVFACPDSKPPLCQYLGDPYTIAWARIVDGVSLTYTNGDTCYDLPPPRPHQNITIYFHCDPNTPGIFDRASRIGTCSHQAHFKTKQACVPPSWFDARDNLRGFFTALHADVRPFDQKIPNPADFLSWTPFSALLYYLKYANESQIDINIIGNFTLLLSPLCELPTHAATKLDDMQDAVLLRRITQIPPASIPSVAQCLISQHMDMMAQSIVQLRHLFLAMEAHKVDDRFLLGKKLGEIIPYYDDCL